MGDYVQSSLSAEVAPSRGRSDGLAASTALAAVAQYARSCGVSDDDLSDALGWSVHALYDPTNRLPDYLGAVLISKLVDLGVGSAPPLDIAEKASISFFSGVERTMILARNGRHALQSFERRIDVIADRLLAAFDETERSVALVFRHPVDDAHNGSYNDVMLAMTARMMRYIVGPHARLKEVRSGYSPNGPRARYDETFGVPVRFNNASGEFLLVYEKDGMLWDNPCHEPSLYALAEDKLTRASADFRAVDVSPLCRKLRLSAFTSMRKREFSVGAVARRCGLSVRSAQRVAAENGTTLSQIMDDARLERLQDLLGRNPTMNADDLAAEVGYSDARSLRRGLAKWGVSSLSDMRRRFMFS